MANQFFDIVALVILFAMGNVKDGRAAFFSKDLVSRVELDEHRALLLRIIPFVLRLEPGVGSGRN